MFFDRVIGVTKSVSLCEGSAKTMSICWSVQSQDHRMIALN